MLRHHLRASTFKDIQRGRMPPKRKRCLGPRTLIHAPSVRWIRLAVSAGCFFTAAMFFAWSAQANEKSRLVLISESHAELARRLHAEAAQVGLVLVDDSAPWQSDSARGVPERHAALGVLRIVTPTSIDLWLLPRDGPPYHQLIQAQTEEGDPFAV